jgi:hypothetical protein
MPVYLRKKPQAALTGEDGLFHLLNQLLEAAYYGMLWRIRSSV